MYIKRTILPILSSLGYRLLSPTCILCRLPTKRYLDICTLCEQDLPWLGKACYRCALPLKNTDDTSICGHCLQQRPHFDHSIALFHYAAPIDHLLNQIKFKQRLANAHILGTLLTTKIKQAYQGKNLPQMLIPVPLHKKRLGKRGYNQALELARPIAALLPIKIDKLNCQRICHTPPQMHLKAKQRRQNLHNAFIIKKPPAKHIAIIDDVMTTGSTVSEFSKALRKAGAQKIDVWVCARTAL